MDLALRRDLEAVVITRDDLEQAAEYAVLAGPAESSLPDEAWIVSRVGPSWDDDVDEQLDLRFVEPLPFEPEIDDDARADHPGADDLDAALAYLAKGGVLLKVPDAPGSPYYRLYLMEPLPDGFVDLRTALEGG